MRENLRSNCRNSRIAFSKNVLQEFVFLKTTHMIRDFGRIIYLVHLVGAKRFGSIFGTALSSLLRTRRVSMLHIFQRLVRMRFMINILRFS